MSPLTAAAVVVLLAVSANALMFKNDPIWEKTKTYGRPEFCGDHPCPTFTVLNKTATFEIRAYKQSRWIFAIGEGYYLKDIERSCRKPLDEYIDGYNYKRQKLQAGLPVVTRLFLQAGTLAKRSVVYYMPESYGILPTPLDKRVQIIHNDNKRVYYVMSSLEMITSMQALEEAREKLMLNLDKAGLKYNKAAYHYAQYKTADSGSNAYSELWVPQV